MGGGVVLPNVSVAKDDLTKVYYKPIPPMNIITYSASAKLPEKTVSDKAGLRTNAFNTTIKSHTFENGVGTIEFNGDVTSIGGYAFSGCSGLTSITIPDSVTSIGIRAFSGCSGLTSIGGVGSGASVEIPSSVTSIDHDAFYGCSGLTSIVIPSGVTSIGQYAFSGCSGLTSITIPDSVTSIGEKAFYNCTSLTSVTSLSITPPILYGTYDDLDGCNYYHNFDNNASGRKIYVPSASVSIYKAASGWSTYKSAIQAIPSV